MKTMSIGSPFLGVNNRLPDFALHVDKVGDFLSSAVNVDVDNKGRLRRRVATTLVTPMTAPHSLTTGYYVRDKAIYTADHEFVALLTTDDPVTWAMLGGRLYYSNGTDIGCVVGDTAHPAAWVTPEQPSTPTLIGGSLLPGWYQIATSYARYDGASLLEEGGVSSSVNYDLAATGGLRVVLPPTTPDATHINVYLSATNGEVPYLLASVPVGTPTYDCTTLATGRESTGRFETPLPAGRLFTSLGRLCSIVGSTVYVGHPYRGGYYLPHEGYLVFTSPVSLAVENQGGTYIATDVTQFIPGDLVSGQGQVHDVLPYGAVPGTVFKHPTKPLVGWFGQNGVVLADAQGQCEAITEDNVDVVAPASGVSCVLESNGFRRVVSCGYCVNLENKAVTTYTGWDFTSLADGVGTMADGIYQTGGDTPVEASVGLGKQDFGTEVFKHLPAVYLGVTSTEAVQVQVNTPDTLSYTYEARSTSDNLKMQRVDPGKGLRANWYDLTVLNQYGADFTLASVSFAPTASTRRI